MAFQRATTVAYTAFARLQGGLRRQRGQTLAEYGVLLAVVAVGVVIPSVLIFRADIIGAFDSATGCLLGSC